MKYYVGIDLGTTNSAISTFDGNSCTVWKSKKDQNDVTPSAIYIDTRGKRYYGRAAYGKYTQDPDNGAVLFKRYMGTSTKLRVREEVLTPEECSAEILRELFKNLPEEIRNEEEVGTVITVPAAFNQMQNAATIEAANLAGFSHVTLMQEPVAAIMSVMAKTNTNANFLIFDLGGGTLDIAVAESISGKVNLLAHGGMAMCGGRDFDRLVINNLVNPWLIENYDLPVGWQTHEQFKKLSRISTYYAEMAKIELSAEDTVAIQGETGVKDLKGEEIYLDIELTREVYNKFIENIMQSSIEATRETIAKSGLTAPDIDRIVFIGGPTNYKPLRDLVVTELGINGSTEVNPMTAVSEGASIYAESIDWASEDLSRKNSRAKVESDKSLGLGFKYVSRTTEDKAKFAVQLKKDIENYTMEITSLDTGWRSGVIQLTKNTETLLPLTNNGENLFEVTVYDEVGRTIELETSEIIISKALATVGAILASHSIGIEVQDMSNANSSYLDYLVREGDTLPCKGEARFRATETIEAGSFKSINFKLWEGEIDDCVEDNRFVGYMKITGEDFKYGIIMNGAEIICNYEIDEAGGINLEVIIPSISEIFNSGKNFYSRQEGQIDLDNSGDYIKEQGVKLLDRTKDLAGKLQEENEELQKIGALASRAIAVDIKTLDREDVQHLNEEILDAKKKINKLKRENMGQIRRLQLDNLKEYYRETIEGITPEDFKNDYNEMFTIAESLMEERNSGFDNVIDEIRRINYKLRMKYEEGFMFYWFCVEIRDPKAFSDQEKFKELVKLGEEAYRNKDSVAMENVLAELGKIKIYKDDDDKEIFANIVKG